MRAVIIANGTLRQPHRVRAQILEGDLLIAADGGMKHCLVLGINPDVLVGDLDSLDDQTVDSYRRAGGIIERHPARKDATDLELALEYAVQRGAEGVIIFGAVGSRWDQSLANLLLPASQLAAEIPVRLVDGSQEAQLLHAGGMLALRGQPGDTVSLIPLQGDAEGITTTGLEYPLEGGILHFGSTRGISNVLSDELAVIHLKMGMLLCVIIRGPIEEVEQQ